jgi:hypothetical protein
MFTKQTREILITDFNEIVDMLYLLIFISYHSRKYLNILKKNLFYRY